MSIEKSIIATLKYHDLFDYPLTLTEIQPLLIGEKAQKKAVITALSNLLRQNKISADKGFYFIKGKSHLPKFRNKRHKHSLKKLRLASAYAHILRLVPTISAVCLTGALAMENSEANDDIDLLIISTKRSLWTSRFLASMLLWPVKRKPGAKSNKNKACLNIFLDEANLKITERNLYTAHELCQMKLLWGTRAYLRLLAANAWTKLYLPNWETDYIPKNKKRALSIKAPNFIEMFFKKIQLFYMSKRITTEKIGEHQVFFHPSGMQGEILTKYKLRTNKL